MLRHAVLMRSSDHGIIEIAVLIIILYLRGKARIAVKITFYLHADDTPVYHGYNIRAGAFYILFLKNADFSISLVKIVKKNFSYLSVMQHSLPFLSAAQK